ncbi:MAG TPA: hypothetical protein V6D47_04620 [Oscillatoriaceae cyanobacterium]
MLGFLVMLLVAAIAGYIGDLLAPGRLPGEWVGAVAAGVVGATLGGYQLAHVASVPGPLIGDFALVPAIAGAALLVLLAGLVFGATARG